MFERSRGELQWQNKVAATTKSLDPSATCALVLENPLWNVKKDNKSDCFELLAVNELGKERKQVVVRAADILTDKKLMSCFKTLGCYVAS